MVRSLDIGSTVSTYQHTFVKLPGDGNVYHARGNVRSLFEKTGDDLRDKRVLSFSSSDIRRIRITAGGAAREFVRQEAAENRERDSSKERTQSPAGAAITSRWISENGAASDGKAVDRLLSVCGDLRCFAFDGAGKEYTAAPLFRIEMEGTTTHVLTLFPRKDGTAKEYPAKSSGSAYPFVLAVSTAEALRDTVTGLVGAPGHGSADVRE